MNFLARLAAIVALSLVSLAIGCNSQTEGQRCDVPSDCQSGLDCRMVINQTTMVCCPTNGASSVASCNPGPRLADAGSTAERDAADALSEGSQDASAEAPAESATTEEAA